MKRKVEEVLSLRTGEFHKAAELFRLPEERIWRLLRPLEKAHQRGRRLLLCPFCQQPVYIAGPPNQHLVFRHRQELGDCPIKTKGRYIQAEIDRMRYSGVKESVRHWTLKRFIHAALFAGPRFE